MGVNVFDFEGKNGTTSKIPTNRDAIFIKVYLFLPANEKC